MTHLNKNPINSKIFISVLIPFAIYILLRLTVPFFKAPVQWVNPIALYLLAPIFICVTVYLIWRVSILQWNWKWAVLVLVITIVPYGLIAINEYKINKAEAEWSQSVKKISDNLFIMAETHFIVGLNAGSPASIAASGWFINHQPTLPPKPVINPLYRLFLDVSGKTLLFVVFISFGIIVSYIFKEPNLIVPASAIALAVDIITVFHPQGFTHQALQNAPLLVSGLSQTIPSLGIQGSQTAPIGIPFALIGPGDVLFMAIFFGALSRFKFETRKTAVVLGIVLSLYLIASDLLSGMNIFGYQILGLPALAPITIVVMLMNLKHFKMNKQEALLSYIVWGLAITVIIAVLAFRL